MSSGRYKYAQLVASLFVLVGVGMKFADISSAVYLFSVGVLGLFVLQIMYAVETKDAPLQVKRIAGLMFVATVMLGLGAYLMFVGSGYWVVMVLLYALISFYLSFRGKA